MREFLQTLTEYPWTSFLLAIFDLLVIIVTLSGIEDIVRAFRKQN